MHRCARRFSASWQHLLLSLFFLSRTVFALDYNSVTDLAVWANEAIVATYTYNYKNFLPRQKEIAKYFTASGWVAYNTALNAVKLAEQIKKNAYFVSAVATLPPIVQLLGPNQWQVEMPILVLYKNPQYQQKQFLMVKMHFIKTAGDQGVRGLAIDGMQTKVISPPCKCQQ